MCTYWQILGKHLIYIYILMYIVHRVLSIIIDREKKGNMRSAKIKNIFVWFVFSFCFFQVLQGVEVQIYSVENRNSLLNNSKTLSFHCRSKDNDLGYLSYSHSKRRISLGF